MEFLVGRAGRRGDVGRRDMMKLSAKPVKFTKCLDDDMDVRPGLFPMVPREMAYFNLVYAHAEPCRLDKDLGIYHHANAPDLHLVENCTWV